MIELIKAGTLFVLGRNPRSDKNFFFLTASNFSFACLETNFLDGPNGACCFLVLGAALVVVFDWTAPVGSEEVFCCLVRGTLGFCGCSFCFGSLFGRCSGWWNLCGGQPFNGWSWGR